MFAFPGKRPRMDCSETLATSGLSLVRKKKSRNIASPGIQVRVGTTASPTLMVISPVVTDATLFPPETTLAMKEAESESAPGTETRIRALPTTTGSRRPFLIFTVAVS